VVPEPPSVSPDVVEAAKALAMNIWSSSAGVRVGRPLVGVNLDVTIFSNLLSHPSQSGAMRPEPALTEAYRVNYLIGKSNRHSHSFSARAAHLEAGVVVTPRETKRVFRSSFLRSPAGAYRRSQRAV